MKRRKPKEKNITANLGDFTRKVKLLQPNMELEYDDDDLFKENNLLNDKFLLFLKKLVFLDFILSFFV